MKKTAIVALTMSSLFVGCNKQSDKVDLTSEDSKTFYTMGFTLGQRFEKLDLKDSDIQSIVVGLRDGVKAAKEQVNVDEYRPKIQPLIQTKMQKVAESEKTSGTKYIETFLKEEGAKKTESGLAYKIIEAGSGATPKETDMVKVHYTGKLTDGSVFDSSVERNQPATFPLNRVIKGWTEGVQLIKPGGKIKLVIPSELAYGDNGAPPKIPGGATLTFDVELLEIVKEEKKK